MTDSIPKTPILSSEITTPPDTAEETLYAPLTPEDVIKEVEDWVRACDERIARLAAELRDTVVPHEEATDWHSSDYLITRFADMLGRQFPDTIQDREQAYAAAHMLSTLSHSFYADYGVFLPAIAPASQPRPPRAVGSA